MKCKICEENIELHYGKGLTNKLKLLQICFSCNFWIEKFEMLNQYNVVRINYNHYIIGKENEKGMRGYDGRKFIIQLDNGKKIITTNLWYQGEIPKRFRKYLPNNAEFITE